MLEWLKKHKNKFQLISWLSTLSSLNPVNHFSDIMNRQFKTEIHPFQNTSSLQDQCNNFGAIFIHLSTKTICHTFQGDLQLFRRPKIKQRVIEKVTVVLMHFHVGKMILVEKKTGISIFYLSAYWKKFVFHFNFNTTSLRTEYITHFTLVSNLFLHHFYNNLYKQYCCILMLLQT